MILLFYFFPFFPFFFFSFNRQFLGLLLTYSFGTTMTDQCRTNFYVNPSDSIVAIMDDDAPIMTGKILGASRPYNTEVPEALYHHSDFNDTWLNRTTLVYADEVNNVFS
jgi:hypothetical protein